MQKFDVNGNCLYPLLPNGTEVTAVPVQDCDLVEGDIIIMFFNNGDKPSIKILVELADTEIEFKQLNPPKQPRIERKYITHILKVLGD